MPRERPRSRECGKWGLLGLCRSAQYSRLRLAGELLYILRKHATAAEEVVASGQVIYFAESTNLGIGGKERAVRGTTQVVPAFMPPNG